MKKLLTGIGSAAVALCVLSACKEKEAEKDTVAHQTGAPESTASKDHVTVPVTPAESAKKIHIKVDHARIPATTADTAAVFFTLKNEGGDDKLLGASVDGVKSVELHETKMDGHVAKMSAVKDVAIGAGKEVVFEHGGLHVMLIGLPHGGLKEGGKAKVTLKFEKAGDVVIDVPVVSPSHGHEHAAKA